MNPKSLSKWDDPEAWQAWPQIRALVETHPKIRPSVSAVARKYSLDGEEGPWRKFCDALNENLGLLRDSGVGDADLLPKLFAKDAKSHLDALSEIWIGAFLVRLGCKVTRPAQSSRRPDWVAVAPGFEADVEVKRSRSDDFEPAVMARRNAWASRPSSLNGTDFLAILRDKLDDATGQTDSVGGGFGLLAIDFNTHAEIQRLLFTGAPFDDASGTEQVLSKQLGGKASRRKIEAVLCFATAVDRSRLYVGRWFFFSDRALRAVEARFDGLSVTDVFDNRIGQP